MAQGPDTVTAELSKVRAEYAKAQEASANARREYEQAKQSHEALWPKLLQPLATAVFGFCSIVTSVYMAYHIYIKNARIKDGQARLQAQKRLAVDMLNEFIAGEFYLKARLISQEYLLEGGANYNLSVKDGKKLNLVDIGTTLAARSEREHQEARFYIRAIPSFFWLIDQMHANELITKDETLFDAHYTWYWVHTIGERLEGCRDERMFRKLDWMIKPEVEAKVRKEYTDLLHSLGINADGRPRG